MIAREIYLEKLKNAAWNKKIKVITGIRRCGKSYLLFNIYRNWLVSTGIKEDNIICIELDQLANAKYRDPITLYDFVKSKVLKSHKQFYLFIDEIQFCTNAVHPENNNIKVTIYDLLNDLRSWANLDVYVTGSNSKMLSSDIATEFRGRATQIHIWPLSFEEYHTYMQNDVSVDFDTYMRYGGMPEVATMKSDSEKSDYLVSLFNELYIKDIMERNRIERTDILENILDFLSSNIGSLTNATNIANCLRQKLSTISSSTVSNYIKFIQDSFLINEAKRYDVKGKHYFNYPNKYYYTDIGLRNARLNFRQFDYGHIMENIIYNELRMRGYSVDVGVIVDRRKDKMKLREIDFVVNFADKRVYIQSAYEMSSEEKIASETEPLKLSNDFFAKIIIQNDIYHTSYDIDGILHCNITDFLLNREILNM